MRVREILHGAATRGWVDEGSLVRYTEAGHTLNTFNRLIQGGVIAGFLILSSGCVIAPDHYRDGRDHDRMVRYHDHDHDRYRDRDRHDHDDRRCDDHDEHCRDH